MSRFVSTITGKALLLAIVVSFALCAWMAGSSATTIRDHQRDLASSVAASHIDEIVTARRWGSEHTRFVRVSEGMDDRSGGVSVRVIGSTPLNPENQPDHWERGALGSFDSADDHTYAVLDRSGTQVFRYAVPLVIDESCSECHTEVTGSPGEIHGALSLTMPYGPFAAAGDELVRAAWLRLGALGALTVGIVVVLGGMVLVSEARLRDVNETLARTNAVLEEQNAAKTQFLATMSHELRTPLNSIIGFSGILSMGMAGGLSAEQRKQVGIINSAGKHLLALINDVLDLSKVEAGRIVLVADEFAAASVVEGVVDIVRPLAEERGLELRVSPGNADGVLYSDRRRIEQVLINLVANAIKHTESGYVSLEVVSGPENVDFVIEDTGIGINGDNIDSIFEEYHQVAPNVRQPRGHGLGLMISRKLAVLLGGKISVRSEPGCGSVFTFRVPRRLPDLPKPE